MEVQYHSFLILVQDGGEWLASCHGHFIPTGRARGTHSVEEGGLQSWYGCVGE